MSALYTEVEERSIQYGAGITRVDNAENLLKCQNKKVNQQYNFSVALSMSQLFVSLYVSFDVL